MAAQSVFELLVQGLFEELLLPMLGKLIRLPGTFLVWLFSKGRSYRNVWSNGNSLLHGLLGFLVHVVWISVAIAACN